MQLLRQASPLHVFPPKVLSLSRALDRVGLHEEITVNDIYQNSLRLFRSKSTDREYAQSRLLLAICLFNELHPVHLSDQEIDFLIDRIQRNLGSADEHLFLFANEIIQFPDFFCLSVQEGLFLLLTRLCANGPRSGRLGSLFWLLLNECRFLRQSQRRPNIEDLLDLLKTWPFLLDELARTQEVAFVFLKLFKIWTCKHTLEEIKNDDLTSCIKHLFSKHFDSISLLGSEFRSVVCMAPFNAVSKTFPSFFTEHSLLSVFDSEPNAKIKKQIQNQRCPFLAQNFLDFLLDHLNFKTFQFQLKWIKKCLSVKPAHISEFHLLDVLSFFLHAHSKTPEGTLPDQEIFVYFVCKSIKHPQVKRMAKQLLTWSWLCSEPDESKVRILWKLLFRMRDKNVSFCEEVLSHLTRVAKTLRQQEAVTTKLRQISVEDGERFLKFFTQSALNFKNSVRSAFFEKFKVADLVPSSQLESEVENGRVTPEKQTISLINLSANKEKSENKLKSDKVVFIDLESNKEMTTKRDYFQFQPLEKEVDSHSTKKTKTEGVNYSTLYPLSISRECLNFILENDIFGMNKDFKFGEFPINDICTQLRSKRLNPFRVNYFEVAPPNELFFECLLGVIRTTNQKVSGSQFLGFIMKSIGRIILSNG